jgi:hypothetical protein
VADRQVVALEQPRGQAVGVEVELVDQQHVGPDPLDDLGDRLGLDIVGGGQVGDQLTLGRPVQGGIEGREAGRLPTVGRARRVAGGGQGCPLEGEQSQRGQQGNSYHRPSPAAGGSRLHHRSSSHRRRSGRFYPETMTLA